MHDNAQSFALQALKLDCYVLVRRSALRPISCPPKLSVFDAQTLIITYAFDSCRDAFAFKAEIN